MKTYYSVEYQVLGIGSSRAWFDNKTDANKFCATSDYRDAPVPHKAGRQEIIDEYDLLVAQTAEWIREREEEGEALLSNLNKRADWGGSRPGAGRPEIEDKRKPRSMKFSDAEWEAIRAKADAEGKTISEYVRGLALRN